MLLSSKEEHPIIKVGPRSSLIRELIEDNKIQFSPTTFRSLENTSLVQVQFLGEKLCGYPGIIHGGLIATLFDEAFVKCSMPCLSSGIGMTASLSVSFKSPCHAGCLTIIHARVERVEGRKVWVRGTLETVENNGVANILAEAQALIIEPKQPEASWLLYFTFCRCLC